MPEITHFYGITVYIFDHDHNPPHIHFEYSGKFEVLNIKTGRVLKGKLPKRAHKMAKEWLGLHKDELLEMWETKDTKRKLPPLE